MVWKVTETGGLNKMADETRRLAQYAAGLSFEDIPAAVLRRAKDCLIDSVAIAYRGSRADWINVVKAYAGTPCPGASAVFADVVAPTDPETAALINGLLIHGLEMDSLRKPGVGVHPGATIVPAALAMAQQQGRSGADLLTAIVAGCEVLVRVGKATKHSVETSGFHAPAITGPFGSAAAAGRIYGFDGERLASAFGIAGSMSGGLLQFAAGGGPLVKRLHLGRAAQSGVAAARWAEAGMAGPSAIVEGKYGMLNGFCGEHDAAALVGGLGETFETSTICFKRYAAHITAHMPIYAIEVLRTEHAFKPDDVASVVVRGSQRMVDHNANPQPTDPISASYSIPFCVAVAIHGLEAEPDSFGKSSLDHAGMRALRDRVTVEKREGSGGHSDWTAELEIALKDGTILRRYQEDFPGTPTMPTTVDQLARRFATLVTPVCGEAGARRLLTRLENIENETSLDWLGRLPTATDA
jgi:2-methylcitrate dehydratase PrpD